MSAFCTWPQFKYNRGTWQFYKILWKDTGHFGLFKTSTLRLREAGKTQVQSQTWRLNISKTDFKSVRKTIFVPVFLYFAFVVMCSYN